MSFFCYSPAHKGYRCLSPSSRIYVVKSVTFNENDFPYSTLFTQPNTPHQSFIHKFSCPSYVLSYYPLVSPPYTHLPTSSSQRHISFFANMSNTFTAVVTDTAMALTLPVSNALSDNACSSFSNSTTGSASLPSCPATGTTVPIVDNIVSTPCTHDVQPITATMSQPLLHTSTNIHSMQTRSKSDIYKPKVYTTVVALPDHFQKPSNVRRALQLPYWKTTMEAEYSALVGGWFLKLKECILSITNGSLKPS